MSVCEYGPGVLFVYQGDVFFGLAECCVGECSEDTKAGVCLSVYVLKVAREGCGRRLKGPVSSN